MTKDAMIMNNIVDTSVLLLILMMFAHIIDDFGLQGIMASMKQKSYWEKTNSDDMYKYDYIAALIMHAFSWSFMIMLPVMLFGDISRYIWVFPINITIHEAILLQTPSVEVTPVERPTVPNADAISKSASLVPNCVSNAITNIVLTKITDIPSNVMTEAFL